MVSIRGSYEYDDDDLTPGKKKEGGLHQNLFDNEGNLKGNARFIPDDPDADHAEPEPSVIYIFNETAPPAKSREQEAFEQAVKEQVRQLVAYVIVASAPHVQRFWQEKARPAIKAKLDRRPSRRKADRRMAASEPIVVEARVVDSSRELLAASQQYRRNMSIAEAQARYLMALAAKAFSDEQMMILANANIEGGEEFAELQRALAELPPQQVVRIIECLELNPSLLVDGPFDLGKILGIGRVQGDALPIEARRNH